MSINKGAYRIFQHTVGHWGAVKRPVGRVLFKDGQCHVLEDNDGILRNELPEGEVGDKHEDFMRRLSHSYMFEVVPEEEINQGEHPDLIPNLPLGEPEPDHKYLLQDGENEPQRVEIYDSHWIVDGQNLGPDEQNQLFMDIRSGKKRLFPI